MILILQLRMDYNLKKELKQSLVFLSFFLFIVDIPPNRQNIICNQLWKGFLTDFYSFNPATAPDFCSFILVASKVNATATISSIVY